MISQKIIMDKLLAYAKTEEGKKKLGANMVYDNNSQIKERLQVYAKRLREILRDEISEILSKTTGNSFLDFIEIDNNVSVVKFNNRDLLSISLSFESDFVMRNSLNPQKYDPVYMPAIVNNEWESEVKPRNYVYGYDRHGTYMRSSKGWKYSKDKGFMKRAVDRFNAEMANTGIFSEYNNIYDGGSYKE